MRGSAETHERIQETAIRFEEAMQRREKAVAEAEAGDVVDFLRMAREAVVRGPGIP